MWEMDHYGWTREEALANIAVAEYVEIPERKSMESGGGEEESFGGRVVRQLIDAKVRLLIDFLQGFYQQSFDRTSLNT